MSDDVIILNHMDLRQQDFGQYFYTVGTVILRNITINHTSLTQIIYFSNSLSSYPLVLLQQYGEILLILLLLLDIRYHYYR